MALVGSAAGCSTSIHPASPLTAEQQRVVSSRPTPNEVTEMPGMTSVGVRGHIAAPPEKVWEIAAINFGKISEWGAAGVAESSGTAGGLGATRHCKIAAHMPLLGGASYDEKIVAWDDQRHYYGFVQTMASGPTDRLVGETWLDSDGKGGTVVTTAIHFSLSFPMSTMSGVMAGKMKKQFVAAMAGLKHYAETGEKITANNWENIASRYPRLFAENNL
jgi:hypothetical protein